MIKVRAYVTLVSAVYQHTNFISVYQRYKARMYRCMQYLVPSFLQHVNILSVLRFL